MTKAIIVLCLCIAGIHCSTVTGNKDILSARSKHFYNELVRISDENNNEDLNRFITEEMVIKYGLIKKGDNYFVRSTIKLMEEDNSDDLTEHGITIMTVKEKIVTAEISLESFLIINEINGIEHVEINSPLRIRK